MNEEDVIYMYTHTLEYYSVINKNEIFPLTITWMDLEGIMLSKSDKERQIPYDIIYMWNINTQQTSEYSKKEALTEVDNKLMVTSEGREGEGQHRGRE